MKLLIVADVYPPSRISGAIQLRDLATEMRVQGHEVSVVVPATGLSSRFAFETLDDVRVLRVRAPRTKDVGLVRRALAEAWLPFALLIGLRASGLYAERWDGIVWYSPTIFLGLVAKMLKRSSRCGGYLIVRDLFPDWAVDAGMMSRGGVYRFFKAVERFQYRVADVIGVQSPSNAPLVARDAPSDARIEILHNWLTEAPVIEAEQGAFDFDHLSGRTIFVYAGNMGVAQDMDAFLEAAARLSHRSDVGFLFVGRGSEASRLERVAAQRAMDNVLFMPEMESELIPALLRRCQVGIVALDPRHTTHNIPGKFVAYARSGLPVLARVNPGNDLAGLIRQAGVGYVIEGDSLEQLTAAIDHLATDAEARERMGSAGRMLAARLFAPSAAVRQVVAALGGTA